MKSLVTLCAALFLLSLGAATASANSGGIAGYSGKTGVTCSSCHGGGAAPRIELLGPQLVESGKTYTFSVVISNQGAAQNGAGLDVAVDAGTLVSTSSETRIDAASGELVHAAPKKEDVNRQVRFDFDWTAPSSPTVAIMYVACNSIDGSTDTAGDADASTAMKIQVEDCVVEFEPYGSGTTGTGGRVPVLSGNTGPCTGGASVDLTDANPNSSFFVLLSFQQAALPYGNRGGLLLVDIMDPSFRFVRSTTDGSGRLNMALGGVTALDGMELFAQAAVLDPAAGTDNFALSNGLKLQISL